ncbi:aminopeptidase P family N-terminal domain-containing protein [Clostridium botulinum]|uniref:aminopeptidase P family N-terminal domain-containing protein n=1 Tax=Clostridium botulinum TaxID=1491 RepID=UPI00096CDD49
MICTSEDGIAWTLNIHRNDIEFFPLILSYLIITMNEVHLFINENKLSHEIKLSLKKNGALFIHSYNKIYKEVITEIMKDHFTITVNSNMHLSHGKFLYCCNSMNWESLHMLHSRIET